MLKIQIAEDENMKSFNQMLQKNYENLKLFNAMDKVQCIINPQKIAEAYGISDIDSVIQNLRDGRSSSFWMELLVIEYYNLTYNSNKNDLYDASIQLNKNNLITSEFIGIKSLTPNGLDLQQSGFKGRGFKGIPKEKRIQALASSVILCDYHIITDIIDAPTFYFIPITSKEILFHLIGNTLPLTIKRDQFYKLFFDKTIDQMIQDSDFDIWNI